jgi:hypothetical protein
MPSKVFFSTNQRLLGDFKTISSSSSHFFDSFLSLFLPFSQTIWTRPFLLFTSARCVVVFKTKSTKAKMEAKTKYEGKDCQG